MRAHLQGHGIEFIEEMAIETFNTDFGIPSLKAAIEMVSGYWHNYGVKKKNDMEKENLLAKLGWKVFYNECPICNYKVKR